MRVGAHGEHAAAVALGPEAVLEDVVVLADQLLELADQALAARPPLSAQLREARRGAVGERAVGVEARGELALDRVERGVDGAGGVERGRADAAGVEEAAEGAGRAEAGDDGADLLVGEDGADAGAVERLADLGDVGGRERLAQAVELDGLAHLGERADRALARGGEGERAGEALARGRGAAIGERFEEAIPLEVGPGLRGARIAQRFGGHGGL